MTLNLRDKQTGVLHFTRTVGEHGSEKAIRLFYASIASHPAYQNVQFILEVCTQEEL